MERGKKGAGEGHENMKNDNSEEGGRGGEGFHPFATPQSKLFVGNAFLRSQAKIKHLAQVE